MKRNILLLVTIFQQASCSADQAASFPSLDQIHIGRHRQLKSDYDVLCGDFQSIYGTCACSMNPDAALGVISTTAFIACTPPNIVVEANFTSNDRYLSSLKYCNDLKDTCIDVTFSEDGSATACSVDYVVSGEAPTGCNSCSPCSLNTTTGFDIDCGNIFAEATTDGCAAPQSLLEFDPFEQAATSGVTWMLRKGLLCAILSVGLAFGL